MRNSSSNWLGVMMSARGTTSSRRNSRDPRADEEPPPHVAHDRIAAVERRRVGRLDPGHRIEDDLAHRLGTLVAGEDRI